MTYINCSGRTPRPSEPTPPTASYIKQFETELLRRLNSTEHEASIVRWVSEKVLESYKNGITAGQKGAQVIRKGKPRGRGTPTSM